jgi:hypothetical protein
MILGKRSLESVDLLGGLAAAAELGPRTKKQKKRRQPPPPVQASTNPTIPVATLDDSRVFRPAAHLAPSDVSFVSKDKKAGFALHKFLLRLRSPVFGAMLESLPSPGTSGASPEPIQVELTESGADLEVFFRSLYSNDPTHVLAEKNRVALRVCKIAHKYGCDELAAASYAVAQRSLKKASLTVAGTSNDATVADLLLLCQETQNPAILNAILVKGVASFCTVPPVQPPHRCIIHPGEPLPCYFKSPGCRGPALLDDRARKQLAQLNPATLVKLIQSLVGAVADRQIPKPRLY